MSRRSLNKDRQLITHWKSFTPTGAWTTNTTYTGRWRRVGSNLELQVRVALAGAPDAVAFTVNLPFGHSVDLANTLGTTALVSPIHGTCVCQDAAAANYLTMVYYSTSTAVTLRKDDGDGTIDSTVTETVPFVFGAGDSIEMWFSVPVYGFRF